MASQRYNFARGGHSQTLMIWDYWLINRFLSEAIILTHMKEEIDKMVAVYGAENAPPPWSTFTIPNNVQEGNMHVVQKVFEGAFEVSIQNCKSLLGCPLNVCCSSI